MVKYDCSSVTLNIPIPNFFEKIPVPVSMLLSPILVILSQ